MKNLLILIGPSAGGKTTFANFLEQNDFKEVVSMTTRPKRQNEVHGESYFFCSEKDFITYIKNGVMIEYAEYCGNYYGNHVDFLIKQVEQNHQSNKNSVIVLELQGAINLKHWIWENAPDIKCATAFCYIPPSEQKNRLISRILEQVHNGDPGKLRQHLETFFDRAKKSESEYDWMKHPTVDVLISCDAGSEYFNLEKVKKILES